MNITGSRIGEPRKAFRAAVAFGGAIALALFASSAAEARKRPPPPPPPAPVVAPPPVAVIPYRPQPPNGASPNFRSPALGANGLYPSVNRNISPSQIVWNLRSGLNVAALNCSQTEFPMVDDYYRAFQRTQARGLAAANRAVDAEFRAKYGARFVGPREKYMTEVYNHFALPMTLNDFCKAAEVVGAEAQSVPPAQLQAFAARSLPSIEIVFDDFYHRYDQYRVDVAAWDARYAPSQASFPAVPTSTTGRAQ